MHYEGIIEPFAFYNAENMNRITEFYNNGINCKTWDIIKFASMLMQFKIRVFPTIISVVFHSKS